MPYAESAATDPRVWLEPLPLWAMFAVMWILYRNEGYARALALAPDENGENQHAVEEVAEAQILADLAICPFAD
jgi:hypothetical protein